MVSQAQRLRLVNHAEYLIGMAERIHYAEVRPMTTHRFATWGELRSWLDNGNPITMDCSESVTLLFRTAGLRDPNGLGYDGQGYTGSLLYHLPHYENTEHAHPGALGVFGSNPGTHVVMLMERNGQNPVVFSHGQEAGPFRINLSDEQRAHEGEPLTWLDISHL